MMKTSEYRIRVKPATCISERVKGLYEDVTKPFRLLDCLITLSEVGGAPLETSQLSASN